MAKKLIAALLILLPALASAEMVSLSVKKGNVRNAPGGAVVWEAYQYTPFAVVSKKGAWVEVKDFEQDTGWIHSSILGTTPSVIVKTNKANLREGAGTGYPVVWVLEKGYPLKIVKRVGPWYQVTDDGETSGWLHESTVWGFNE